MIAQSDNGMLTGWTAFRADPKNTWNVVVSVASGTEGCEEWRHGPRRPHRGRRAPTKPDGPGDSHTPLHDRAYHFRRHLV